MLYPYSGLLFYNKKKQTIDTYNNLHASQDYYDE